MLLEKTQRTKFNERTVVLAIIIEISAGFDPKWRASRNAGRGLVLTPKSTPTPETSHLARAQATYASQKRYSPFWRPIDSPLIGVGELKITNHDFACFNDVLRCFSLPRSLAVVITDNWGPSTPHTVIFSVESCTRGVRHRSRRCDSSMPSQYHLWTTSLRLYTSSFLACVIEPSLHKMMMQSLIPDPEMVGLKREFSWSSAVLVVWFHGSVPAAGVWFKRIRFSKYRPVHCILPALFRIVPWNLLPAYATGGHVVQETQQKLTCIQTNALSLGRTDDAC
ncbi:hypothetical protein B0H17DRAFT_1148681 [Mycena rosella]|uniref:Uncharacterized protein n=1 Tax=Mycena rosella TaxID=1033263 RepID=A0AAD7C9N8_MYCRO|nr:hypothetical protein B0H17DRAFT_1148681 [Mycena rosella]